MSASNVDLELNKELEEWNPMLLDYKSTEFNQYNTGPGAELDVKLQPGELAKQASHKQPNVAIPIPYLVFKNIPKDMTKTALYNICSRHGRVKEVRENKRNQLFFVDLESVADMESVYRALEQNCYGFKVFVGRQANKKPLELDGATENKHVPSHTNEIDMESRTYRLSNKQLPRPYIPQNPFVTEDMYKGSELHLNDPKRHYLIEDDAHDLERAGVQETPTDSKYMYHTGRAIIELPEKTKNFIETKCGQSSGRYSPSEDNYVNNAISTLKPKNINKCAECGRVCDVVCSRCSTYYCGLECQQKAWPKHRYVCGKITDLKRLPNLSSDSHSNEPLNSSKSSEIIQSKESPNDADKLNDSSASGKRLTDVNIVKDSQMHNGSPRRNMPRSGNLVTVTAVTKTNIVFVRSKAYEDNMSYFKTIGSIQGASKTLKPLQSLPMIGQIVVAKFKSQFNRAMVLNLNNERKKILVVYIDYGNRDMQVMENLFEAPEEFASLPFHAVPVVLKDVPDCYMTDEIRNYMYSYLNGINVYIKYKKEDYVAETDVYHVELIDEITQQNFNKVIKKLAKPVEPSKTSELCYRDYLEHKLLAGGDNVELIVMDNSLMNTGCITCTSKVYALEIQKFQKELQCYSEALPRQSYAPRPEELCIAKYSVDQKWYRGRCLETVGDGYPTIVFFDYGNIALVNIDDIRRYPRQFTYPIYTSDCEIKGLPDSCDDELVAKLEELIPNGSTIICAHVQVFEKDHFYSISLPDVIQKLKADGFLLNNIET